MAGERWATFDCYGTLIDWNGGIGAVLGEVFGEQQVSRLLVRYHQIEPELEADGYRSYRDVMDMCLAAIAQEEGVELGDDRAHRMSSSMADWPAFPEVPAALEQARSRGWKLAILSNCDRDLIASSLPRLGARFDRVIVAEDVGSYKPAFGHWRRFSELTGADPERHVHVGASLFHDIAPSRELGLPSVWVNRLGEAPEPPPDREIPDLSGLPDALDALRP